MMSRQNGRRYGSLSVALVLLALLVVSCKEDRVEVKVVPRLDGTFARTLRLWQIDTDKPKEILPPQAKFVTAARPCYGKPEKSGDASVVFQGDFRYVPADLAVKAGKEAGKPFHNHGGYDLEKTPAGALGIYRERRPGPTDYYQRLERAGAAIDVFAGVAHRMLRTELSGEAGLDKLLTFLKGPFRKDMKDVFYLLTGATEPQGGLGSSGKGSRFALAVELLVERGYFRLPDLLRRTSSTSWVDLAVSMVASRMGRSGDEALEKKLRSLLKDGKRLDAAFVKACAELGFTQKEVKAKTEVIGEILSALDFGVDDPILFGNAQHLTFRLVPPAGATIIGTSGHREKDGSIVKTARLDSSPTQTLFFVEFVVPDKAWQTAHLGRVCLDGEDLASYVLFVIRLSPDQRKEWDAKVNDLEPGPKQKAAIRALPLGDGRDDLLKAVGAKAD